MKCENLYLWVLKNQKKIETQQFKKFVERDLPFCSRFGFDKLKAMSKDDDVETDDCLV